MVAANRRVVRVTRRRQRDVAGQHMIGIEARIDRSTRSKLASSRPAPTSSTSANATWLVTSNAPHHARAARGGSRAAFLAHDLREVGAAQRQDREQTDRRARPPTTSARLKPAPAGRARSRCRAAVDRSPSTVTRVQRPAPERDAQRRRRRSPARRFGQHLARQALDAGAERMTRRELADARRSRAPRPDWRHSRSR